MPSVIFGHMHPIDFDVFCIMFNAIGWDVYVPSNKEPNYFGYGATITPSIGNYTAITYKEALDIKPDVVLCLCLQHLKGAYKLAREAGSKLVVRSGNNNVPYRKEHSSFLISNDTYTYHNSNIPNKLLFYLPPNYDFFYKQVWQKDSNIVTSYINYYSKFWKESWSKYTAIRALNFYIAFINFGVFDGEYSPYLVNQADVRRTLGISRCVLHIKEKEGYGWSILEAIYSGIPVIAPKRYVLGKTCEKFLVDGKTAILIGDDPNEFSKAFNNMDVLYQISEIGLKFINEVINVEEQYSNIKIFLEGTVLA